MNAPAVLLHPVLTPLLHLLLPAAILIAAAVAAVAVDLAAAQAVAVPEAVADIEDNIPIVNIMKSSNQNNDCCFLFL